MEIAGGRVFVCQVNTPWTVCALRQESSRQRHLEFHAEHRNQIYQLVLDTTNPSFGKETQISATSSDEELISMVRFVEQDRCLVRSHSL